MGQLNLLSGHNKSTKASNNTGASFEPTLKPYLRNGENKKNKKNIYICHDKYFISKLEFCVALFFVSFFNHPCEKDIELQWSKIKIKTHSK